MNTENIKAHAVFQPNRFWSSKNIFFGLKLGTVCKVIAVGNNIFDDVAGHSIILLSDNTAKVEFAYKLCLIYYLHGVLGAG
jgi:hypothetical protein